MIFFSPQYLATIIFGLTRIFGQLLGSFLLIRFKRRHLLIFSSVCTSLGTAMLAVSAMFNGGSEIESKNTLNGTVSVENPDGVGGHVLGFMPLIAVICIAVTYHVGLGPIVWSYTCKEERENLFAVSARSVQKTERI